MKGEILRDNAPVRLLVRLAAVVFLWSVWPDAQARAAAASLAVGLAISCVLLARRLRERLLARTLNHWFEAAALLAIAAVLMAT